MTDIVERLRSTTEQMASTASVDMALWDKHSNACLEAADEIERLRKALLFFFDVNDDGWGFKYTHIEAQRLAVAELTRGKSDD